jgi:hypothetical protein
MQIWVFVLFVNSQHVKMKYQWGQEADKLFW